MTYGVIVKAAVPIEAYDATHAAIVDVMGGAVPDGMILHMAWETADGFEAVELWDTKEQAERFGDAVVGPAMMRSGVPADSPAPERVEFEPRTVVAVRLLSTDAAPV